MLVKNISNRTHWVGDILIAPGEKKEVSDDYANSINTQELFVSKVSEEVKEPKKSKKTKAVSEEVSEETTEYQPEATE